MAAYPRYPLKRGASLALGGSVALPGTGWAATAQMKRVKDDGTLELVAELDVDLEPPVAPDTSHGLMLRKDAEITAEWELADYRVDVRFTNGSFVTQTNTFVLSLVQEITGAPA